MYIKKLQVFNYKSYFDSGVMEFTPGVNIIVGRNNAGKTSLLEVLTLDFEDHPHRSLKKLPTSSSKITKESRAEISLLFDKEELVNLINQLPHPIGLPYPEDDEQESWFNGLPENVESLVKYFQELLDNPPIKLNLTVSRKSNIEVQNSTMSKELNFDLYYPEPKNENGKFSFVSIKYSSDNNKFQAIYKHEYTDWELFTDFDAFEGTDEQTIGYQVFNIFKKRIYRFKAERLNIDICKFENNNQLQSDASNLAEVISKLQGANPGKFVDFNKLITSILPEIKWISVLPRDNSDVEIIVWTIDPQLNRDDLSLPLSSCGSGVGQVLAIVYILVSSEEPRTLIIDEPQSFLHPGAAKKLIETIKQFPQHQYFIATHSPDIITTADPTNIIKLKYENCETTASVIDAKDIDLQKEILDELGIRLSDVFGADSILWVEGETEEKCYPLILEKILDKQLRGIKILAVQQTGDFEGTKANLVFDIYKKLSEGSNLFPPAIGFLFDSEGKSEEEKKIWQERSKKPVEFLSRRMYENYLLDSEAIAAVFNEENQARREPLSIHITKVDVEEWLEKKKQEEGLSEEEWLYKVHASNIFKQLFSNFSQRNIKFRKPKHPDQLTKWLVENKPDFLSGLANEIANMLNYEERSHRQP
jgi:AAA15 family ATPase/GTPase